MIAHGVKEYNEGCNVEIQLNNEGALVVKARNEGGYNSTEVDLKQLIEFVKTNFPELLN